MPRSLPVKLESRLCRAAALLFLTSIALGLAFWPRRATGALAAAQTSQVRVAVADWRLTAEACAMPDGLVDPGEQVTLSVGLQNTGTANTSQQLVATLQATGGVTAPSDAQDYGRLSAGGPPVFRSFSFTAASQPLASVITLTFRLSDNGTNRGTVSFDIVLGQLTLNTDPGQCAVGFNVPPSPTTCVLTHCVSTRRPPFPVGVYTIICDTSADTRFTMRLVVQDGEAPQLACPASLTRPTDPNQCVTTINLSTPSVTDNCPGVTVSSARSDNQPLAAPYPKGTTTIQWKAVDAGGQEATCQQTVTVNDTQPPVIACPGDINVTGSGNLPTTINYPLPTASDGCQSVSVHCTPPPGTTFPAGVTAVNCTATDSSGNATNCSFRVSVNQEIGLPLPPSVASSDGRAGAVLAYPIFTSSAVSPQAQNTRISLTNIDATRTAFIHLFFINDACSVADVFICLTAQQTASFLASDYDPGTSGYLIAVAVDQAGCPVNFNTLVGDEYVKFSSGHAANLSAEAFAALAAVPAACNAGATAAELKFDGVNYSQAARMLIDNNVPSRADGNDTLLIINRLGGDLRTGASPIGTLSGMIYDDTEAVISVSITGGCQLIGAFPFCAFPRQCFTDSFIPAGRSGWMKLFSQADIALFGCAINRNSNARALSNAYNQGHNLHKLTLSAAGSLIIPISAPQC